jgi:uncharacterized protein (TIRG00374 family)
MSLSTLLDYAQNADIKWILLGLLCGLLSHFSRAYRWLYMAEPLGFKPRLANSFMAVYSAYLINYTIPRAGEIARATILSNYENVPFDKGFGTIVSERIADMIMLFLIIGVAMILQFEFIVNFFAGKFNLQSLGIGLILVFAFFAFLIFIKKHQSNLALRIKNFLKGILEGAMSIFKMKNKWLFLAHTIFIWVMYLTMFYVTTLAIPGLNFIPFAALLVGFILASFSIAATNAGIGSFPEAIVIGFSLFSLPEDPSRAFGWIMWASQTVMIAVIGGLSLLLLPVYNRTKQQKKNIT